MTKDYDGRYFFPYFNIRSESRGPYEHEKVEDGGKHLNALYEQIILLKNETEYLQVQLSELSEKVNELAANP